MHTHTPSLITKNTYTTYRVRSRLAVRTYVLNSTTNRRQMEEVILIVLRRKICSAVIRALDPQDGKTPQLAKLYKINQVTFFIPCKIFKWMDLWQVKRLIFRLLFHDRILIWQEPFRKFILFPALGDAVQLNIEIRDIVQGFFQCDGERQRILRDHRLAAICQIGPIPIFCILLPEVDL